MFVISGVVLAINAQYRVVIDLKEFEGIGVGVERAAGVQPDFAKGI